MTVCEENNQLIHVKKKVLVKARGVLKTASFWKKKINKKRKEEKEKILI